jgi:hypothetical protein
MIAGPYTSGATSEADREQMAGVLLNSLQIMIACGLRLVENLLNLELAQS